MNYDFIRVNDLFNVKGQSQEPKESVELFGSSDSHIAIKHQKYRPYKTLRPNKSRYMLLSVTKVKLNTTVFWHVERGRLKYVKSLSDSSVTQCSKPLLP